MVHREKNIPSIVSAGLSGLAGGATLASPFGIIGMVLGSIAGGLITGSAEYIREKKNNNTTELHSATMPGDVHIHS